MLGVTLLYYTQSNVLITSFFVLTRGKVSFRLKQFSHTNGWKNSKLDTVPLAFVPYTKN